MKKTMIDPIALEEPRATERALWRPLLLLALPVMLAGGVAISLGVHTLRQSDDLSGWSFIGVGGVVVLIGVAVTVMLLVRRRKLRRGDFDVPEGEAQPWRVRADWVRGKVRGEARSEFLSALAAAVCACLLAGTVVLASQQAKHPGFWRDWFYLIFPPGGPLLGGAHPGAGVSLA